MYEKNIFAAGGTAQNDLFKGVRWMVGSGIDIGHSISSIADEAGNRTEKKYTLSFRLYGTAETEDIDALLDELEREYDLLVRKLEACWERGIDRDLDLLSKKINEAAGTE